MRKNFLDKDGPAFPAENALGHTSTGMSVREYAAIHLKVPDSGVDWLDEMIQESKKNQLRELLQELEEANAILAKIVAQRDAKKNMIAEGEK